MFGGFQKNLKHCSRLKNPVPGSDVEQCYKKTWNTQKTPTKHVLRLFKNFLKIWFSAQKSGSRLRCRTMLKTISKHLENTNKTCFEAFWEILENPVLGLKCGYRLRFRTMLKYLETLKKHQLNMFWGFFRIFLKIRFSAQKSGSRRRCRTMLKILWNTQKTPTKHALRHFKKFVKIWFFAEKSGSRLRFRTMLKYLQVGTLRKHQLNTFWGFLRNFWKSGSQLKHPVLGSDVEQC